MSADCERVRRNLRDYGRESLPAGPRQEVREHLAGCAACRMQAASIDPTALFGTLAPKAVSSAEVASVVASVRAGIALRQVEKRIARRPVRRREQATGRGIRAAAAAAVVLLTLAVPSGPRSPSADDRAAEVKRAPKAGFSTVAGPDGAVRASGGATVYDWNPGAGEPRVVWIVDGSLDI